MTCIAAIAQNGKVWMAGDSGGCAGWDLVIRADQKVFVNGPFLMGFTTSWRMGQILRYSFSSPEQKCKDDMKYMVTTFIDAVRKAMADGGYMKKHDEVETGGDFLVGYRGRIYRIFSDFQVQETACGYDACGCGASYALGAIHSLPKLAPKVRLKAAMKAAEAFSNGVRGPFVFKSK